MKAIAALLVVFVISGSAWAQGRVATLDLRKVFDSYWKKTRGEAELKDQQTDMEKVDKGMIEDYKKSKEEYQSLLSGASDPVISAEEKEKRKKSAEDKLKQLKDKEVEITQYENTARSTIMERYDRMRSNILTDIRNVVNAKAKASGFSLVIDTAAESVNKTPVFLYTNNENDITDAVLQELNRNAPADLSKADEKPAPDKKK